MNQPPNTIAKINNIWIVRGTAPANLPQQITSLYLRYNTLENLQKGDEMRQKFPNLFPEDTFHVAMIQSVYHKLYGIYQNETNPVYKINYENYLRLLLSPYRLYDNLINLFIESYSVNPLEDAPEIENLRREIRIAYREAGFTYSYFGWINEDNIYVKAKRGNLPLRIDTFEAASFFRDNNKQYKDNIKSISNEAFSAWRANIPSCNHTSYLGWKKGDIVNAIKKSGLWKKPLTARVQGGIDKLYGGIMYKDIDIRRSGAIIGLTSSVYMSACYYDTIYRKMFNTANYINWGYLCKNNFVDIHTLRHIATKDFGVDYKIAKTMKSGELCQEITKYADAHEKLTQKLAKSLDVGIGSALALRPESAWVKPPTRYLFKEETKELNPFNQYNILKEFCENTSTTKEDLVAMTIKTGIRNLIPENLKPFEKEDICEYLLGIYLPKAQKYESIAIDCADPYINKRNIMNTATIMGIGNILPKDLTHVSKSELCDIINNYVNVLREAKALTFAPPN